jgi:hypothetical protein
MAEKSLLTPGGSVLYEEVATVQKPNIDELAAIRPIGLYRPTTLLEDDTQ